MAILVDIEKKIGSFRLKVNFEAKNETLALLGASGCGKSMTLKCIAGIEKPDKGRILIDGITLFDSEKKINLSPQERRAGLMFQNYALFPNMTVVQNISSGANREKNRKKRIVIVSSVMESFGLTDLAHHYPSQLSGGQQQRVALARILISEPRILLLDEPFSALDSHLRFRLEQDVREIIRKFGKTVLLVSHDRDEVYRMADSIAVMRDGQIEAFGLKKDIFASPGTVSGAMLTGCKNISRISFLNSNTVWAIDWGVTLNLPNIPADTTSIGIRMHDISIEGLENRIPYTVTDVIENTFSYVVMLVPKGTSNSMPLGWEIPKALWDSIKSNDITVSLPSNAILFLKDK